MYKISVITIVRNDLEGLKRTVASVQSQNTRQFEYILIDGNSTDGCREFVLAQSWAQQRVSEPDTGIYNAMNKGVSLATGDYCLFMNAGDTFYDSNVISQANEQIEDADIYIGHAMKIAKHRHKRYAIKQMTLRHLLISSVYHQSTFTRTALLREHPYREDLRIVSDWAFFLERWVAGANYQPLDFFVSNSYVGGVSTQHGEQLEAERRKVISELFPSQRVRECLLPEGREWRKIFKAMSKTPLQRDLSLVKYGLRFLLKDIL